MLNNDFLTKTQTKKILMKTKITDDVCIFCALRDERVIGECDYTKTFIDSYPASPGHTLIVPKRHFATYFEASKEELLAIGEAVQNAKKNLRQRVFTRWL